MEHLFNIEHAKKWGVNAAIVLRHLQFWILKNKANKKHDYEGRTWSYNSVTAMVKIWPYWSQRQVWRIFDKLIAEGIIIKGNFNRAGYDRTLWYAFADEEAFLPSETILPNGKMDFTKPADPFYQTAKPIPNPIPIKDTDNLSTVVKNSEEMLALDLQIVREREFFTQQIGQIFHPTKREATTFALITRHLVRLAQQDEKNIGLFKDAVEWARQAKASTVKNPKGLFVAKIKKETGFRPQKKLL